MSVEMDIRYEGDLRCAATHGPSRDTLTTDAPVDNGGKGAAFSPSDLVATALGACMVTLMGLVAKRTGLDLNGTRVHVVKEMVSEPVRRIGTLAVTVTLPPGRAFSAADREKLERAAKTCPVKQSLHPDVNVRMEFVYPE
jgi:putative redox protein